MLFKLVFGSTYDIRRAVIVFLLLLLPSLAFVSSNLVWDDFGFMKFHSAWTAKAMLGPYLEIGAGSSYWRPLAVLTIAVPAMLQAPFWTIKLIGVVLYFFKGVLALLVLDALARARGTAMTNVASVSLAAVLALHPLFVEAMFWVSARCDLLLGIFVMFGAWSLARHRNLAVQNVAPPAAWRALLGWLLLTMAACGSKDTGFVWSALAIVLCIALYIGLDRRWKRYGLFSAAGGVLGCLAMIALRAVFMPAHGTSVIVTVRTARSFADYLQVIAEFLLRGFVNIFIPALDPAPFKSAGWFTDMAPGVLLAMLFMLAVLVVVLIVRLVKWERAAALMVVAGVAVILFHAALSTVIEPTLGTVFSPRYIDPSTTLLFIVMALLMNRVDLQNNSTSINWPVAAVMAIVLLQSLMVWSIVRMGWYSDLDLWRISWENNSRAREVNFNYTFELSQNRHFAEARAGAKAYLKKYPEQQPTDIECKMYDIILNADRHMNDPKDGQAVARDAISFARCSYNLANEVSDFLLKSQCPDVLAMLRGTLATDDSIRDTMGIIGISPVERQYTVLNTAIAELQCGDRSKATPLIERAARFDPSWRMDGPKAQELIRRATEPSPK